MTLCGELASKPVGALALLAIGYRSLSLAPSAVGPVKAMLLELDVSKASALLGRLLSSPASSMRIRERLSVRGGASVGNLTLIRRHYGPEHQRERRSDIQNTKIRVSW